jgi:hypothetical protein
MGIDWKAQIINNEYNETLAVLDLSNYRAYRILLNENDDYGGKKEFDADEALSRLAEVKNTFVEHGYPNDHHGPMTCEILERMIQLNSFKDIRVIFQWS